MELARREPCIRQLVVNYSLIITILDFLITINRKLIVWHSTVNKFWVAFMKAYECTISTGF